jgi:hypothetical protein
VGDAIGDLFGDGLDDIVRVHVMDRSGAGEQAPNSRMP